MGDHADFTVLDDSLRINDDVIFEGEQLLIQMKWRNQGNILSESYSVEIFDITEQESIATNARPRLSPGGTGDMGGTACIPIRWHASA